MAEELISKNVAGLVKVRSARKVKRDPWSVEEARKFLEAASTARDPLYAAYVLILVLGFRGGEVLGLTWQNGNLDAGEVTVQHQLQRIRRRLVHDETKTEASTAVLPLPEICVTALQLRWKEQEAAKQAAGELWTDSDFVFTTRYGTPVEPRNFNRCSPIGPPGPVSAGSGCMTHATPVDRCSPHSTCTRASRCRSSGTARSR
ncbi:hypothetical protein AB0B12_04330 [Streptomyces sp. NPDC044780]|uniref:hypothetical protein n=1 Tax=unclassified Streptomyces TaxID=2593676 RepID=UPI0034103B85